MRFANFISCVVALFCAPAVSRADAPDFAQQIVPLLKQHCVKCHGPAKKAGELDLSIPGAIIRGGKQGAAVVPHDADASLIWQRVEADEMPPELPLSAPEKKLLKEWIVAGSPGLPATATDADPSAHWSFQPLRPQPLPDVQRPELCRNEIDRFIESRLEAAGLHLSAPADPLAQIRRVAFDVTGLPPTITDLLEFPANVPDGAYSKYVTRLLHSPQYGERMGKVWLDAAGYMDSNGYFNADSDRPLAYRYRDWVVRAINRDLPYDQFLTCQIAGDELAQFDPAQNEASPETIELLEATHFLRNGQDGTGESDGNADEVRIDRYTVLESAMQTMSTSLLGLTIQCAKCHDHKFEPLSQQDYYAFQAVLAGVFAPDAWVKPNDRLIRAAQPGEFTAWEEQGRQLETSITGKQAELATLAQSYRARGTVLFQDNFDAETLITHWSHQAPGDSLPAGIVAVNVDSQTAPAAHVNQGQLQIIEGGTQGSSALSTRTAIDWTPEQPGEAIQVTFDLVSDRLTESGNPADRIGYYIALRDYRDQADQKSSPTGNLLIDGNPGGPSSVHLDYPGDESLHAGNIGKTGYKPGHNYGIRVTNRGDNKFLVEHLVDGFPEEQTLELTGEQLPDGGFGFEYCCGRSFVVDHVLIESFATDASRETLARSVEGLEVLRKEIAELQAAKEDHDRQRPGLIAWATDVSLNPPDIHLLLRGNHATPGPVALPSAFQVLSTEQNTYTITLPEHDQPRTTGRRLAWVKWLTAPGSRSASLLARVHVNRIWQHHFGTGLVATPENLGLSGAPPSHPELLEWLAGEFVRSNWSTRHLQELILNSATYRQSSQTDPSRLERDADCRLLSRFPVRRLDAEAIRDGMLAVSGELDLALGGPYVPTTRDANGEVMVPEDHAGARRRSLYLQQRRTQILSLLQVFDAPSIVFNSVRRPRSTIPLQSLSLLNSEFAIQRARHLAERLTDEIPDEKERLTRLVLLITNQRPTADDVQALQEFLDGQTSEYAESDNARQQAWADLCQLLFASNSFLYLE